MPPCPILLFGRDYWHEVIDFEAFLRHGMIDAADLKLLRFVDDPEEAWEVLLAAGILSDDKQHPASPGDVANPP